MPYGAAKKKKKAGYKCVCVCSVQSLSHVQLFVTLMDYSTPDLPVHHQLLEPAQTHVH